jgi:hypothetical protein
MKIGSIARAAACVAPASALAPSLATAANATPMQITITITPDIAAHRTVQTLGFSDCGPNVISLAPTTIGGIALQGEFGSSTFGAALTRQTTISLKNRRKRAGWNVDYLETITRQSA